MIVDFLIVTSYLVPPPCPHPMDQGSKCRVRSTTFKGGDVGGHHSFEANKVFTNSLFSESS